MVDFAKRGLIKLLELLTATYVSRFMTGSSLAWKGEGIPAKFITYLFNSKILSYIKAHVHSFLYLLGNNEKGVGGGGGGDAFRDLHPSIMSTFVNVKIVRFAVIVNKERKTEKNRDSL